MKIDKEMKEKLDQMYKEFRNLTAELCGKTMDYETCRMLEDFFKEYTEIMLKEIEKGIEKIKDNYDLIPKKGVVKDERNSFFDP